MAHHAPLRLPTAAAVLGALLALLALAGPAGASSGITPLSPKSGASVPVGKSPTFKMRVRSGAKGQVWVHICKSKHKRSDGTICPTESIGRAKKGAGGVYTYKPKFFDFPSFWLNSPGTYYWQAFRIACEGRDCAQEGPIVKFSVG